MFCVWSFIPTRRKQFNLLSTKRVEFSWKSFTSRKGFWNKMEHVFTNRLLLDSLCQFLSVGDIKNLRIANPHNSSNLVQDLVKKSPMIINRSLNSPVHVDWLRSVSVEVSPGTLWIKEYEDFMEKYSDKIRKMLFKGHWEMNHVLIASKLLSNKFSSLTDLTIQIGNVGKFPVFRDIGESFPNLRSLEVVDRTAVIWELFLEQMEEFTQTIVSRSPNLKELKLAVNLTVNLSRTSVKTLFLQIDGKKSNFSTLKLNQMISSAAPQLLELKVVGNGRLKFDESNQINVPQMNRLKYCSLLVGPNPQAFNIGSEESIIPFPALKTLEITCEDLGKLCKTVQWPNLEYLQVLGIDLNMLTNLRGLSNMLEMTRLRILCRDEKGSENLSDALIHLSTAGFVTYIRLLDTEFEIQNLLEGRRVLFISVPWTWPKNTETHQKDAFLLKRIFWRERKQRKELRRRLERF